MKKNELIKVVNYLRKALKVLYVDNDVRDSKIRSRFVEYLVALKLTEKGHRVNVGNEKQIEGRHDIETHDRIRIEVKSGEYRNENDVPYVNACFYKGTQIKRKEFDYCVFVTFSKNIVKEAFIFTHEELREVADRPRPKLTGFPKEHPCLLFHYPKYVKYADMFKPRLKIEIDLHKNPEKYKNRWDKIAKIK